MGFTEVQSHLSQCNFSKSSSPSLPNHVQVTTQWWVTTMVVRWLVDIMVEEGPPAAVSCNRVRWEGEEGDRDRTRFLEGLPLEVDPGGSTTCNSRRTTEWLGNKFRGDMGPDMEATIQARTNMKPADMRTDRYKNKVLCLELEYALELHWVLLKKGVVDLIFTQMNARFATTELFCAVVSEWSCSLPKWGIKFEVLTLDLPTHIIALYYLPLFLLVVLIKVYNSSLGFCSLNQRSNEKVCSAIEEW